MEKFYTVNETAQIFSVKPNTIWRWIDDKNGEPKLKSITIGKSSRHGKGIRRIPQSAIDEFKKELGK